MGDLKRKWERFFFFLRATDFENQDARSGLGIPFIAKPLCSGEEVLIQGGAQKPRRVFFRQGIAELTD